MKNKRGFTLIELLAVIVILGVILVIATTSVIKSINDSKVKAKYTAAKEIVNIAEAYMATETDGVDVDDKKKCVSIQTLIDNDYLEKDVTNPLTGENGGNFEGQKVCTSSTKAQDGYEASANAYNFDGYEYILGNGSEDDSKNDKEGILGDVNGDGKVTKDDAELVQEYDAGTGSLTDDEKKRADVNGDGDVDAGDSVMISQLLLKETGDINGDKKIDEEDALLILKHDSGISSLTKEQEKRADLNNDGVVDAGDAVIILRIINNNK